MSNTCQQSTPTSRRQAGTNVQRTTEHLSLSLNSERNGIIILASKQRLLWRGAPEMFKVALEKLCFQAQTYVYTAEVPDQFFQKGWRWLLRIF